MEQTIKRRYHWSPNKLAIVQQESQNKKDASYFIVSPSQRYFKRVFNKEYLTQKKQKPSKTQRFLTESQSKSFVRSPHYKNHQRYNHFQQPVSQRPKQESIQNFSMGLFRKSNAMDDNSFFDSTSMDERKSKQRKLNFGKIFIVQQNTPFKQVIQLSERQLQNKEMLEKAMHQLEKRKLQKKFKMLKKQMKLDLTKHKLLDQSIQDLRSHRIGYKTFYRKEVLSQRESNLEENKKAKINQINNQEEEINQTQSFQKIYENSLQSKKKQSQSSQINIFLQNERSQNRKRNKTHTDEFPQKQKINNFQSIPRQKRRRLVSNQSQSSKKLQIQLPFLNKLTKDKKQINSDKRFDFSTGKNKLKQYGKTKNIHTQSAKSLNQSFKDSKQHPILSRFSQFQSKHQRNSQKLLRPSLKQSKQLTQNSVRSKTEQNVQQNKKNPYNDQFTLLLSKQELQSTLNKSRYEMKKLLCLHIQNRKKQWRKNKSKSLLNENFIDRQFRQMTKSQRKFISQLKPIEETSKQMQNSRYFDQMHPKNSILLAPTHLLKLHTKQLKKQIKSFVKKVKAHQSPKRNIKFYFEN